jgi:hypothetical protein
LRNFIKSLPLEDECKLEKPAPENTVMFVGKACRDKSDECFRLIVSDDPGPRVVLVFAFGDVVQHEVVDEGKAVVKVWVKLGAQYTVTQRATVVARQQAPVQSQVVFAGDNLATDAKGCVCGPSNCACWCLNPYGYAGTYSSTSNGRVSSMSAMGCLG